jgi:hypothetical protein
MLLTVSMTSCDAALGVVLGNLLRVVLGAVHATTMSEHGFGGCSIVQNLNGRVRDEQIEFLVLWVMGDG